MLEDKIISKLIGLVPFNMKYPKGNVYFDKLSHIMCEIVYNDGTFIKMKTPDGTIFSVYADVVELAVNKGLFELIQCVQ